MRYRYGFNGKEKEDDVNNGSYTAEYWQYDSRLGRRWNIDPIVKANESPYACFANNPVFFIDPDGRNPINPRTGRPYHISLFSATIYDYDDNKPTLKVVEDEELLDKATYSDKWFWDYYGNDTQHYVGDDVADQGLVGPKIPQSTRAALDDILGKSSGGFSKPGKKDAFDAFQAAARVGTYSFVSDAYSEYTTAFNINKSSFNIISVEENYITKVINLSRDGSSDDNKYSVNSVITFSIQKGVAQTREKSILGIKFTEKFRTLTVTETEQKYVNNQKSGATSSKTYTTEEIIE